MMKIQVDENVTERLRTSCRVCLSSPGAVDVFSNSDITAQIKACAPIRIAQDDGLPCCLCNKCVNELNTAFIFHQNCLKSDEILSSLFRTDEKTKLEMKPEPTEELLAESGSFWVPVLKNEVTSKLVHSIHTLVNSSSAEGVFQVKQRMPHKYIDNELNLVSIKYGKSGMKNKKFKIRHSVKRKQKSVSSEEILEFKTYNNMAVKVHGVELGNFAWQDTDINALELHENESFYCPPCEKLVTGSSSPIHKKNYQIEKNPCEFCGKEFNKYTIKAHIAQVHMKEKIECQICLKKLGASCIYRHMKRMHNHEDRLICDTCGNTFAEKTSLRLHIERVHLRRKSHRCSFCERAFYSVKDKKEHERLHTGIRPFECPKCSKSFTQRGNMKSHFARNHRGYDFKQAFEQYKNAKAHNDSSYI